MPNEQVNRMLGQGFLLQSVLFSKNKYTPSQATKILKLRGYIVPSKVDVTDKYIRFRMHDPQVLNTFHTIPVAKGIKVIMGKKAHQGQHIQNAKTLNERRALVGDSIRRDTTLTFHRKKADKLFTPVSQITGFREDKIKREQDKKIAKILSEQVSEFQKSQAKTRSGRRGLSNGSLQFSKSRF